MEKKIDRDRLLGVGSLVAISAGLLVGVGLRPNYAQDQFGPRQEFHAGDVGADSFFQLASFTPQATADLAPPPVTVRKPKPDAQPVPAPGLDPDDQPPVLTPTVWSPPPAPPSPAPDVGAAPQADRDDIAPPPATSEDAGGGLKSASSDHDAQ